MFYRFVSLIILIQLLGINLGEKRSTNSIIQSETNAASPYDDEFSTLQLDSKWYWVREDSTHWNLSANPGFLEITTQPKDIWQDNNTAPLLLQTAPAGNFTIETKILSEPTASYHQGGLTLYVDDDNYIRLTYGFFNERGFQFAKEINGIFTPITIVSAPESNTFYLRIERIGTSFFGYFSEDGNNWTLVGLFSGVNLIPSAVGLIGFNGSYVTSIEIPAQFDYFREQRSNVLIDDTSLGYYSTAIVSKLAGTQLQFPPKNTLGAGEPNLYPSLEPDIDKTSEYLGNWLSKTPLPLNPQWSTLGNIPKNWTTNTTLAVIYSIDGGDSGIKKVTGSFGVDNGMFLWVNGIYKFGATQPGALSGFEYVDIPLGDLSPGMNYIQILVNDHGQVDGFTLQLETGKSSNSSFSIPNIPIFYQGWPSTNDGVIEHEFPEWYNAIYGFTNTYMGYLGCNTTSHAMIINYYAKYYNSTFLTDPGTLNANWINDLVTDDPKEYVYNSESKIVWGNVVKYLNNDYVQFPLKKGYFGVKNDQLLDAVLFSGNPVILHVKPSATSHHFVTATGKTTKVINGILKTTYTIYDPMYGPTTLAEKYGDYVSFYSYQPAVNNHKDDLSNIQVVAHSPVHLLLIDPSGRKLGYDPRIDKEWTEIPNAGYDTYSITDPYGYSLPEEKIISIPNPINGNYLIQIIGYADGEYEIDIEKMDKWGHSITSSVNGIAYPSSVTNQTIVYSSTNFLYLPVIKR